MPVWLDIEQKLGAMPSTHLSRLQLPRLDSTTPAPRAELDTQGRVVVPVSPPTRRRWLAMSTCSGSTTTSRSGTTNACSHKLQREAYSDEDARALSEFGYLTHVPGPRPRRVLQQLRPEQGGGCSPTAPWVWAATRAPCSPPAPRGSSGSTAMRTHWRSRAKPLAPWADRVELVHADYRALDAVLDARQVHPPRRRPRRPRRIVASIRRAPAAASAFSATSRSTCGWIGVSVRRRPILLLRRRRSWELADAIFQYGEERFSRRIARALVDARREAPIETTGRLAAIVRRVVPRRRLSVRNRIRRREPSRRCASG